MSLTVVHKPDNPDECWSCLKRVWGFCWKKARPGKLTCWHHRDAEQNAQDLKRAPEALKEPSLEPKT